MAAKAMKAMKVVPKAKATKATKAAKAMKVMKAMKSMKAKTGKAKPATTVDMGVQTDDRNQNDVMPGYEERTDVVGGVPDWVVTPFRLPNGRVEVCLLEGRRCIVSEEVPLECSIGRLLERMADPGCDEEHTYTPIGIAVCVSRRPKKDDDRADDDKKKNDDTGTDDKTKDDDSKADDGDDNKSDGSSSSSSSMVPAASSSAGAAVTQESPNRSRVRPDPYAPYWIEWPSEAEP